MRKIILILTICVFFIVGLAALAPQADADVTARYKWSGNRLVVSQGESGRFYHKLCDADDGNRAFLKVALYEQPNERVWSAGDGECWPLSGKYLGGQAYRTKICERISPGNINCSAWKGFRE